MTLATTTAEEVENSGKDDDNTQDNSNTTAPDGGWGWVVVAGATILNFMVGGAVNTFGVLYVALLEKFQQSAGTTAWVGSLANAMGLLLGPISSALSTRFSCRNMVIIGGIFASAGWITTGFMPRLEYMFATYGILSGLGKSLSFTPSILILGQWFDKRRSLANGIALAGNGVGTFAFAPILEMLIEKYGFSYTMLIMGGFMLVISACGFLFRPVPNTQTTKIIQNAENGNKEVALDSKESVSTVDNNVPHHKTAEKSKTIKYYLDYTLLGNLRFLSFGVSVMLVTLGHSPASVMLLPLAIQNDVAPDKAAFLLSIIGVTDIIGRLSFGVVCDIETLKNNRKYLYVASMFISGIANITCGFASEYWHFVMYSVIFGLFAGSYHALTPVILVDLLGKERLPSSFGLALLFQGIGFLLGPPMAGWMKDGFNSYQSSFFFAGVAMAIGSILINIEPLCRRFEGVGIASRYDLTFGVKVKQELDNSMSEIKCNPNTAVSVIGNESSLYTGPVSNGVHINCAYIHEIQTDEGIEADFVDVRF